MRFRACGVSAILLLVTACAGSTIGAPGSTKSRATSTDLRLGYFPNLTHAAALVGIENGIFERHLGDAVKLVPVTFNAGPAAVEALFSGAIDATYLGPNPAINAFSKSNGEAIRIVAGAASGGAFFVVKSEINGGEDLKGKKLSTPQLGNTQDVALRTWLKSQGLETDLQGGGDVSVQPQENAQTLETFRSGQIDGAWVPEPWATRLVNEGGGKVLIDEASLWPDGRYLTAELVVRTEFLEEHPDIVKRLLGGHVEATGFVADNEQQARDIVNSAIKQITGKAFADDVIEKAWQSLLFTYEPLAETLKKQASDATRIGLLEKVDLDGTYHLDLLNEVLESVGKPKVKE